jgi:hypothetical protein
MSRRSDEYQQGVPQKSYDLIREGLLVLAVVVVVIVILAGVFGSPDYPTVTGQAVATDQPIAFLQTSTAILAGESSLQEYGPPYTKNNENAQRLIGIAPSTWFGVTRPIDASQDLVIKPLERVALFRSDVSQALDIYQKASSDQQDAWGSAYLDSLDKATIVAGKVQVPPGDYGPVPVMMDGMYVLAKAGLLEGALQSNPQLPYAFDSSLPLLYFEDDVDHNVAGSLNMLGSQWGIIHETGGFPGAWWLWPYAFFYQIPPMNSSANGDLEVGLIMLAIFLIILFTPVIPGLNRIPRGIRIYRLIWRDWYRERRSG